MRRCRLEGCYLSFFDNGNNRFLNPHNPRRRQPPHNNSHSPLKHLPSKTLGPHHLPPRSQQSQKHPNQHPRNSLKHHNKPALPPVSSSLLKPLRTHPHIYKSPHPHILVEQVSLHSFPPTHY